MCGNICWNLPGTLGIYNFHLWSAIVFMSIVFLCTCTFMMTPKIQQSRKGLNRKTTFICQQGNVFVFFVFLAFFFFVMSFKVSRQINLQRAPKAWQTDLYNHVQLISMHISLVFLWFHGNSVSQATVLFPSFSFSFAAIFVLLLYLLKATTGLSPSRMTENPLKDDVKLQTPVRQSTKHKAPSGFTICSNKNTGVH